MIHVLFCDDINFTDSGRKWRLVPWTQLSMKELQMLDLLLRWFQRWTACLTGHFNRFKFIVTGQLLLASVTRLVGGYIDTLEIWTWRCRSSALLCTCVRKWSPPSIEAHNTESAVCALLAFWVMEKEGDQGKRG